MVGDSLGRLQRAAHEDQGHEPQDPRAMWQTANEQVVERSKLTSRDLVSAS